MAAKEKVRRSRIRVGLITAKCQWRDPTLTISCYMGGNTRHEVVVEIQDPNDVRVLQAELEKFITYWRAQL